MVELRHIKDRTQKKKNTAYIVCIERNMSDNDNRHGRGGEGSKAKGTATVKPAKSKSVKQMMADKMAESTSKVFKKKKINPKDADKDDD